MWPAPRTADGAASAWLGLRLQLLAAGLVGCVGLSALASAARLPLPPRWAAHQPSGTDAHNGPHAGGLGGSAPPLSATSASLAASLAGLGLAYALPVVGLLSGLLTSTAETEQARSARTSVQGLPCQRCLLFLVCL